MSDEKRKNVKKFELKMSTHAPKCGIGKLITYFLTIRQRSIIMMYAVKCTHRIFLLSSLQSCSIDTTELQRWTNCSTFYHPRRE
jgi:hypothetical protein